MRSSLDLWIRIGDTYVESDKFYYFIYSTHNNIRLRELARAKAKAEGLKSLTTGVAVEKMFQTSINYLDRLLKVMEYAVNNGRFDVFCAAAWLRCVHDARTSPDNVYFGEYVWIDGVFSPPSTKGILEDLVKMEPKNVF